MKEKTYLFDNGGQKKDIMYQSGIFVRVFTGVILFFVLYLISQDNYLLYHEVVEITSIAVASGIFFIIWNSYRRLDNYFFLILAIGIIFSAFFDLFHMMSYKGMGVFQYNSHDPSNLATQLWLAARLIQGFTYLTATFFLARISRWKVVLLYSAISVLFLLSIFQFSIFPIAYTDGHLTLFKIFTEYFICLMFFFATILIYKRRGEFDKSVYRFLIASFIITILSEISFTFYTDVYGIMNFSGHILKVLAYYFLYHAIVVSSIERPHNFLFRSLVLDEEKLKLKGKELRLINYQLKKENSEVETLLSSIGDGIVALNREGVIQFANPAFAKIVDSPLSNIVGRYTTEVLRYYNEKDVLVPKSERPFWIAMSKGKFSIVKRSDYHYLNNDGHRIDISITAAPVLHEGKITGSVAVFRDITKEKEIERTKTEYVSLAAHQLRTPLSTMRLTTEVVLSEIAKKNLKNVEAYSKDILEEIDEMSETVDRFLNVTKIEAGLFVISPKLSKIPQLLSDYLRLLGPQFTDKKVKVDVTIDPILPTSMIDPKVFEIIVDNLLSNAIKYTKSSGKIDIKITQKNQKIIISIGDNGSGIPKQDQARVFKKLFRSSSTLKTEGTGLGLYIVKLLVEQSGGKIWFESSDKGTVFYVSYPLTGMKKKQIKRIS